MEIWSDAALAVLKLATGNPGSSLQLIVLVAVSLVVFAVMLKIAAQTMRMPLTDIGHSLQATVVGGALVLAAAVLSKVKLAPILPAGALRDLAPLWGAIVGILVFVAPLVCAFYRGNYFQSLAATVLSLIAASVAVFLVQAWFGAAATGEKKTEGLRRHKTDVEKFMRSEPRHREIPV
jgi:hypothetical protein